LRNGAQGGEIVSEHDLTPQFGQYTPLGKLYALDAKVLFLGTDYETCTCFHMGEALAGNISMCKNGAAIDTGDARQWVWFSDYDYDSSDFGRLGAAFEEAHAVGKGKVGQGDCRLFSLKSAVDFSKNWLAQNRTS
jgi:aminoglycoside 3-N-acetyltransferase